MRSRPQPAGERRRFLELATGLLAPALLAAERSSARELPVSRTDEEVFDAYVRMRGSHSAEAVYERTIGCTYAVTEGRSPRLLWAVDGVTVSYFQRAGSGSVRGRNRYLGIVRDPETGERLRRFEDAESGVAVEIPVSQHPTASFELTPKGVSFGAAGEPRPRLRPLILGSTVSFTDQMFAPPGHPSQPKLDVATLTADRRQAFDRRRPSVDASISFTGIERWRPWMRQGNRPGGLLWHVIGRKVARRDVPREFFDLAREVWNEPLDAL